VCDPASVLTVASVAIGIGGDIAKAGAQNKAAANNKAAALAAEHETLRDISLQEQQQQDAAGQTIMQTDRQARQADALASVSAGESGVAGASVDALISNLDADAARANEVTGRNLDMTIAQLQREKLGAAAEAQNRINSVQPANPFATILGIGGIGIDAANTIIRRKPGATS